MDLHLPEENGWEILEQATNNFPLLPVVILTGLAHQGRAALAAGAGAFLEKPTEVPVLLNTIEHLLAEPFENRLRRFSSFLESTYWTPGVSASYLRRMPDYVRFICPQFSRTHVNFQRVPTVDTSNPFVARFIPSPDESFVVIRFRDPKGIDFPYLLSMLHDSFMSRPNSIVVPGGKMELAMQLIFTPMILQLMDRKRRAA
jgi:hypothetical protein